MSYRRCQSSYQGNADLVGPIVVGWLFVIALVLSFVGVSYVIGTERPAMLQHMMAASVSGQVAHEHVAGQKPGGNVFDQFDTVKLKQIGCSNSDDTVTVGEARNPPPDLNWFAEFGSALLLSPLPQTLIVTLVVYVVVRAIGWVIGGFAA